MMNEPKNFNKKEWKNKIREAYIFALHKMEEIQHEIESLITEIDPVELLSHVFLRSQFFLERKPELNQDLEEKPIMHFLAGLCLKKGRQSDRHPNNQEIEKIIKLIEEYFDYYLQNLVFQSTKKDQVSKFDYLILSARLQKIISQINPSIYPFQLKDLLKNVFGRFDDYFIKKLGFSATDALNFGQKIIKRYERLLNKRLDEAREVMQRAKRELKMPIKGSQLREILRKKKVTEEEFIENYFIFLMFTLTQEIFVFAVDEFCKDEEIKEVERFKNYLKALSCKFGEVNKDFNSPLDENAIIMKPIINIDKNRYFSPIPQDLICSLPLIFESFLEEDKRRQTRIWQKFQNQKSQYTEYKIYEYFSRLFPKQSIFRNLRYNYKGEEFEVDVLISYDDKIFVIEAKAGVFSEPAKRGAIKRLRTDLKKLVVEAYQQGRRARDYIKFSKPAVFKDRSGKEVFRVEDEQYKTFFIINVTLEPLMSFTTSLKWLQSLDLFEKNEYPWSVYLFDLDLITSHIPSPTIFIHYLEKRLSAQEENVFLAFDELTLFGWYMENGNFYIPIMDEGEKPDLVSLDGSWVTVFDDHYLFGKDPPELKIEPELVKIIKILEEVRPLGYSNIASALLDFDHQARKLILEKMNELIKKTKKDRKKHDFSVLFKEIGAGFTFMSQWGSDGLRERLVSYCTLKKYKTKTKRWIGIGKDVLDDSWFVNEFVYLDFPWESDPRMDELLKKYPFISAGKPHVDN